MIKGRYRWARHALSVCAVALAATSLLISTRSLESAGWSNERTILYAAEGGFMSPREALMQGSLSGAAMLIWLFVLAATFAPPNRRARWVFRGTALGAGLELVLGTSAGILCDDIAGYLFIGGMLALPMALVAIAVRRWAMHGVLDHSGN